MAETFTSHNSHALDPSQLGGNIQGQGRVLGGNEVVAMQLPEATAHVETFDLGDGSVISGSRVASLEVGSDENYSEVIVFDISRAPVIGTRQRETEQGVVIDEYRQIGVRTDGKPLAVSGNVVVVVPSKTGGKALGHTLKLGEKQNVGRNDAFINGHNVGMPDTVSRDHCAVGVDNEGRVIVENHDPVNTTRLITPSMEAPMVTNEALPPEAALELLSYTDILSPGEAAAAIEYTKSSPNGLNYARELQHLVNDLGLEKVTSVAEQLRQECMKEMQALKIAPSKFGESISWALWDIAKQHYYYIYSAERDKEYDGKNFMAPGDPMSDSTSGEHKRKEIVDRHLGWEVDLAVKEGRTRLEGTAMTEARDTIKRGQRNETGQLRSHELAALGRRIRRFLH